MNALTPIQVEAKADPFFITGPAMISFSGGRTSAYMLWRILQAHGGTLPDDVVVCFANTGREMPATLDFVRDVTVYWNVHVVWLEYRRDPETGRTWTEVVSHNSASRNGEPFDMLLAKGGLLPNQGLRYCTAELKINAISKFLRSEQGWMKRKGGWTNVVGLRADEESRVEKMRKQNASGANPFQAVMPLFDAGVIKPMILDFWRKQPFDLMLPGEWAGNCDGCFLKKLGSIYEMKRAYPERLEWWARHEEAPRKVRGDGRRFRIGRPSYRQILNQGDMSFDINDYVDDEIACADAGCGV